MYAGTTLATNVFMPWKICCTFSTQSVFNNSLQNALLFALIFDNADNVNVTLALNSTALFKETTSTLQHIIT